MTDAPSNKKLHEWIERAHYSEDRALSYACDAALLARQERDEARARVRELGKEYNYTLKARDNCENDYYRILEKLSDDEYEVEMNAEDCKPSGLLIKYDALREAVLMADRGKSKISGVPPWVWERIVNIANGNEGGGDGE